MRVRVGPAVFVPFLLARSLKACVCVRVSCVCGGIQITYADDDDDICSRIMF